MTRQSYAFLSAAIVIMLGLVWMGESNDGTALEHRPLLPGLAENLSSLGEVKIEAGDKVTTLQLEADNWLVAEKHSYPANTESLTKLVRDLSDALVVEQKTARAEFHPRLGLDDASSIRITISAGDEVWTVLLGNEAGKREATFVRLPNSSNADQVWLVNKSLDANAAPADWLAPSVIDLEAESVTEVRLEGKGRFVHAVRDDPDWTLLNLPADRELKFPGAANALARALVRVQLEDVKPASEEAASWPDQALLNLADGSEVMARLSQAAEQNWLWLPNSDKKAWIFEVNQIVYDGLTKGLEDFLKPVELKEAEAG